MNKRTVYSKCITLLKRPGTGRKLAPARHCLSIFLGFCICIAAGGTQLLLAAPGGGSTFDGAVSYRQKMVEGVVTDVDGNPLSGATIKVVQTSRGTTTDETGNFSLQADQGQVLEISMVGYATKRVTVGTQAILHIQLAQTSGTLQDVVMIGYGSQKKADLTGALSAISASDFSQQQVTSVSQVLQGRAAGVQVNSNSGAPGGVVSVRIRGNNSILGDNNPLYVIDGFVGADASTLNPGDIEDMTVLKDASATAIYGSRGANGVVLISTKRGRAGHQEISLDAAWSSAQVIRRLDVLTAAAFARTANDNAEAGGVAPLFSADEIAGFGKNGGTDWQDEIFRHAPTQQYQLSASGGNDKTSYYVGGNYLNQQGVIINSYAKRYALRANLQSHITPRLTLRLNSYAARNETNNTNIVGRNSPVMQAIGWSPTLPVFDANGNYTLNDPYSSITNNPVALAADQDNVSKNSLFTAVLGLKYDFTDDLSLDVSGGVNYNNRQMLTYVGAAAGNPNPPKASRGSLENMGLQGTGNLSYDRVFNGVHHLTATGVIEVQSVNSTSFNISANNLTFPDLQYYGLAQAGNYSGINSPKSFYQLLSVLGRVAYDYNGQYFITATVRRDGSSKFAPGHQYSTFPSAGVAWDLSKYDFVRNSGWLTRLKIRAGYGMTGNQAINPYQTLNQYTNVNASFQSGTITPAIVLGNPGNPSLKWETTKQTDIGLDLSLLDGRLDLTADYYNKNTSDLLFPLPIPNYLGGGFELSNVGEVNNHGLELSLTGEVIRSGIFHWQTSINYALLRNELRTLYGDVRQMPSNGSALGQSNVGQGLSPQPEFMLMVGRPLGTYWGLTYLGPWQENQAAEAAKFGAQPGDARYEDLDGNYVIDGGDYHEIGNGLPRYSWGWNNTFTWNNLSLNVFIQALGGYQKLDYTYAAGITANSDIRQATLTDISDRYVSGTNEHSWIPNFSKTNLNYTQSTRFLEDGQFIRFKNISLNYTLPEQLLSQMHLSVFVRASNLFTITNYKGFDPESNNVSAAAGSDVAQSIDYGSYPNAKTFTLGFKLTF